MSIIPQAALTTTQLISGLAASAKNALDVAKVSSDRELKASVSELYDAVLDVKARVLELDEENRRLKTELAQKDEVVGPDEAHGYFFYKDRPNNPLCPKCFQSTPSSTVFLGPLHSWNGGQRRGCSICGYHRMETPMDLRPIRIRPRGFSGR